MSGHDRGAAGPIEFDSLSKIEQDRLMEAAIAEGDKGPDEPEPEYDPTAFSPIFDDPELYGFNDKE